MRMVDQTIAQKALKSLNKGFTVVAKRHLHSAWVFALLGITVAFVATLFYFYDSRGEFSQTLASAENYAELVGPEMTADYHVAVASGENTNLIRWDPEYTRIPKDSIMGEVMMVSAVLVGMFAPIALPAIGITGGISGTVASGISSITGISIETVTTVLSIVRGASTVSNVLGVVAPDVSYSLPVGLNWGALDTGGLPTKLFAAPSLKAAPAAKTGNVNRGVNLPDANPTKIGNRAIAEITKKANASIRRLDTLVCGKPLSSLLRDNNGSIDAKTLYGQLRGVANEKVNDFKSGVVNGRRNEIRSIFTIAGVSGSALEGINKMDQLFFTNKILKQRCPTGTGEGSQLIDDPLAAVRALSIQKDALRRIDMIAKNELGVLGKTAGEVFERTDGRTVLEFDRAGVQDATVLTQIEEDPLPGSSWVGFRNGDVHGKAAQDNTVMVATDTFTLTAMPIRAFIGIRSTDAPVEVRANGITVNNLKEKVNRKNEQPYKTRVFELGNYVGIGTNRIAVAIAQSAGARAKFALNYVMYVVCEPGVQCVAGGN